jgi:type III secretion protein L
MKFFSLLDESALHPEKDGKIIAKEDFTTLLSAADVLEKAKKEAVLYREKTEEERRETLERAQQEGFEAGLKEFNEEILKSEKATKQLRHDLFQKLLPLALKASKKIVGKELELHPETIVEIVLNTLASVSQNHRFTIYVNKADKELLEQQRPRIKEILSQLESLTILEREDVSVGGCIIETESGIINAAIENQWRALEAAFEKYMTR